MSRVAVTGAKGFIGAATCDRLRADGHEAVEIDLPEVDVTDAAALETALAGCDGVVHTAAIVDEDGDMDEFVRVNVGGTRNVVELCRRCAALERLHHVSTAYVAGLRSGLVLEEETKAELGGRVGARSERLPGIDDDGDEARVRVLPGRPDPEPADPQGPVKPLPRFAPPGLHIGRDARPEHLPEALFAPRPRVGGELDPAAQRHLLESFGEELDQKGAGLFGALCGDAHGHAA